LVVVAVDFSYTTVSMARERGIGLAHRTSGDS
jgi:hypothetical protein